MGINGQKSLYNQLEETIVKLNEIVNINKELKEENKALKITIQELTEQTIKLMTEIDRLKNQINKNSSNSSKPGSTDNDNKPDKSGANLYNSRVNTGKSVGGQIGREGKNLSKENVEEMIKNKEVEVIETYHSINGNSEKAPVIKYRLGIKTIPVVEKHIFVYDEKSEGKLPLEFYTDVTYNDDFKSTCVQLGSYNVVAIDRLSDFINIITNGVIKVSNGSICNFYKEFSKLSENVVNELEEEVLNKKIIYTDLTGGGETEGKKIYFRNYSAEDIAIYKCHTKKGHAPIKEDNILPRFQGGIMGDHDTALYSYGANNYECNTHASRYLEELEQNISYISWPGELQELLFRINSSVQIAKLFELKEFDDEKINEYLTEYDSILEKAKKENNTIKSTFYKDKAKKLLNRLIKYKDNHLAFVKDFHIPFTNNLSEQDLRIVKTKIKISNFRSFNGAKNYANALTIIKTAKKRKINPFLAIKNIFGRKPCFEH